MKNILKIFGIIVLVIFLLLVGVYLFLYYVVNYAPMVPKNYVSEIETGGDIEAKYLAIGKYEVSFLEEKSDDEAIKKYEVWYPQELQSKNKKYPVVVVVNGTGVFATKSKPLFEHLASWGFIVIGNEDPSTWNGKTADKTLKFLLNENENKESIFYGKVDINNIGITGHSQGGVGVFNAITINEHSSFYKCAVSLSPTEEEMAELLKIPYDSSKTTIPMFMLAGTDNDVISLEKMKDMYDRMNEFKVMARKSGQGHGQMLYSADGYVTAWFMWHLKGNMEAAKAFVGENPEILNNQLYEDQNIGSNIR